MATKTEEKTSADRLTVARNKNLDLAIQQIAKDYGDGGIMRLGNEKIVDLDDLLVSQPSSGEEALRICETLVRSNALDVIVVDSVAALVTKAELEGEIGDTTVGAQARLMSAALRKLTSLISKARTCCVF